MAKFVYRAKKGPNRTVEGELAAESRAAALAALDAMGCSPVWVRGQPPEAARRSRFARRRILARDVTIFARQMAGLLRAGVPILKALATVAEQSESARLADLARKLTADVRDGNPLSLALARHPKVFSELFVSMALAGESAGALDTMLFRLAEAREREEETRRKVQSALAYPIMIVGVGVVTVFVLLAFFLPKVAVLFRDYRDLPLPTRILMNLSDFFSASGHWIVLGFLLLAAVARRLAAMEKGRTFVDTIRLRLPLLGTFLRQADIARFGRTLALLLDAGIQIDRALSLSAGTLRNSVLRDTIVGVRQEMVNQGMTLSDGIRNSPHFPPLVANLTAVGEESGQLDKSLLEMAAFYDREIDYRSRMFIAMLEPILILAVGGVVGFIVAAMLLPIFKLGAGI
ncbi:MAG: type II secretion system F family protein [Verrucomicrobiota bacterium]|nr:type II secretion system F family protein [Verrucomicrobiota bacterium]